MHATGISNRWAHDLSGNTPAGINASMSRINQNVRSRHGRALRYARYWPFSRRGARAAEFALSGVKQTPVRHDVCLLITQRAKGYL